MTIKAKLLIASSSLFCISLIIATSLSYFDLKNNTKNSLIQEQESIVEHVAESMDSYIDTKLTILNATASEIEFMIMNKHNYEFQSEFKGDIRQRNASTLNMGKFKEVIVGLSDGSFISERPIKEGFKVKEQDWYQFGLKLPEGTVKVFGQYGTVKKQPKCSILYSLFTGKEK